MLFIQNLLDFHHILLISDKRMGDEIQFIIHSELNKFPVFIT